MADRPQSGVTDVNPDETGDRTERRVDEEFARLVDQLLPPEPSPRRRLGISLTVLAVALALAGAWNLGYLFPNPASGSGSGSAAAVAVPEPDMVAIANIRFSNDRSSTLTLTDVRIDAPGLDVERIVWFADLKAEANCVRISDNEEVCEMVSVGTPDQMYLQPDRAAPLPAEVPPQSEVWVAIYARVTDCTDPTTTWGTIEGRWEHPGRPAWLHRWVNAGEPLWEPGDVADVDLQHRIQNHVTVQGRFVHFDQFEDPQGPLSRICQLQELDR